MPTPVETLKFLRQTHLYIGVFIAPALLFFAFTGALQTFTLHETTKGSTYKPPTLVVELAQLHKDQTPFLTRRKPAPPAASKPAPDKPQSELSAKPAEAPAPIVSAPATPPPPAAPTPKPKIPHLPMKIFFLLVAIGLFTSTLTGIYMAYKYNRNKFVVTGLLLAGIVIPLALLRF